MRDGRVGEPGYGAASDPGGPDWDQGSFHDGAIPGPRSGGSGYFDGSGGAGDPGGASGSGGFDGPGGSGDSPTPSGAAAGAAGHGGGHRRGGRRKTRSRKRKVFRWVAIVVAVAVLGTAGAAYGYYEYLAGKIRKGERSSGKTNVAKSKANSAGQTPMNIMILGSDTRSDPEDAKLGGAADATGARADVIMIAHLSADRSNMSVVSIPRDTRVDIPECTDPKTHKVYAKTNDIINASLSRGGAGCTLATVQNLTGVYIDHWLTIDFAGVVKMADVVGGVDVCVKENVDDHATAAQPGGSHLHLTAGTHTVKGQQALQWLRTRHAFGSDAGRSKAQHMYMSSLIRKLRGQNLFTDPAKLNKIATTAMSAFEVSSEIGTPKKLYDLGMQLKTIPPNRITMLTMPRIEDPQDPNAHYLPAPSASTVWSLLRNDVAMDANGKAKTGTSSATPTPSATTGPAAQAPASIPVTVVNGTAGSADGVATPGRAGALAKALGTAGFTQAAASQDTGPRESTVLNYPSSGGAQSKSDALSVAKALKIPSNDVKASSDVQTITLTVGSDWKSGTDYSATLPKAGSVPDDADVINGADTTGCMDILPVYQF
ncbi:LCP family protein [Actinacidiphila sp. bgisy144]|uniref:LCP family protein n=1 Tax=unclassified Actinacidiphila TaxID=2995708 RepID=UPI003EBB11DF